MKEDASDDSYCIGVHLRLQKPMVDENLSFDVFWLDISAKRETITFNAIQYQVLVFYTKYALPPKEQNLTLTCKVESMKLSFALAAFKFFLL